MLFIVLYLILMNMVIGNLKDAIIRAYELNNYGCFVKIEEMRGK